MNKTVSVDVSALIQECNRLQKANETLKNNLKYEQQLRMNVEKELLLLQEELKTNYKKKKSSEEREREAKERVERKVRGTTKDGRPLPKAAQWIESYEEFEAIRKWLFEESAKNPIKRARNRYAWSLGCAIGIRGGDLVELKWEHLLDKEGNFKEYIIIAEQKTSKTPLILITEAVKFFTKEYIEATGITPKLADYIFATQKSGGKPESKRTTYSNIFKAAGIACEIPRQISSHAMRHSFVTIICCLAGKHDNLNDFQKGMYIASKAVGHGSQKVTERYSGMSEYIIKFGRQIVSDFVLGKSEKVLKIPFDIDTGDCTIQFKEDFAAMNKCLNETNF